MSWSALRVVPDDDPGGGIVRIDADVDGRPVDLVLDTGAARTTLPASVAQRLPDAGTGSSGTAFGRGSVRYARVPHLRVGELRSGPLTVGCGHDEEGQLGLDVLARHRVTLDLDGGRIGFDEGDHVGPAHPLDLGRSRHPHLTLRWGDIAAYAVVDTGSSVSLVDTGLAKRHPELLTLLGDDSTGTDAAGIQQSGQIHTLAGPSVEGLQFAAHTAAVVDLRFINAGAQRPVDLVVGYPMLRQAIWVFDFPQRSWSARLR